MSIRRLSSVIAMLAGLAGLLPAGSSRALPLLYGVLPHNGTPEGSLWVISPPNPDAKVGQPTTVGLSGLAIDSTGALYASTFAPGPSSLLRIHPATGALLSSVPIVSVAGEPLRINDLATQPGTDRLYATSNAGPLAEPTLHTIDRTTGVATLVGLIAATSFDNTGPIGFAPDGTLYFQAYDFNSTRQRLYRLNPATGQKLDAGVPYTLGHGSLAVGPDGIIYGSNGLCCNGSIGRFDPVLGQQLSNYGGIPLAGAIGDLAFFPVPEPTTLALVCAGLALIAGSPGVRYRH